MVADGDVRISDRKLRGGIVRMGLRRLRVCQLRYEWCLGERLEHVSELGVGYTCVMGLG